MVKYDIQITHYCKGQWGVSVLRNDQRLQGVGEIHRTLTDAKAEAAKLAKVYGVYEIEVTRYIFISRKTKE
jgi:hypothetical protein